MAPLAAGRRVAAAVDRIELLPRAWHLFELGSRRAAGADGRDRGDRRERGRHVLVGKGLARVARAARARGLALTVHLEPYGKRTAASTADDIRYLRGLGVRTFYVYDAERIAADEWSAALTPFGSARLFAHTRLVGWAKRAGFDGIYTYTNADADDFARLCTQARAARLLCSPTVSPGFDARRAVGTRFVRSRRSGHTYDAQWCAALRASPDLVTIASYNEWHEGTQIEPASSKPPGKRGTYRTYVGAYRLRGKAAERAYLARTALWAKRFRAGSRACSR